MAKAGQEIYNPDQRDRIVFREMAADTNGETLRFELVASPHSGNRLHVHPRQEERFQVLSGTFGVRVGDEQRSLGRGERLVVPAGTPHGWWNDT
jgi:mannose-6-phosphate isomerase-like protein (cupin superfamily)